ncbi:MAG: aldose 1-epimerase [Micavibrio sp.]|nr:aldose 1-epimerase [Micavibrio sp.]
MSAEKTILHIESAAGLQLSCCPAAGGSITAFRQKGFDLFRPYDAALPLAPLNTASFPLTPYSNRIINGKLAFNGETYTVGPVHVAEGHQLHGDGWLRPWQVTAHSTRHVALLLPEVKAADSPYIYEAEQIYSLADNRLTIEMSITNRSGFALPFGLGHHPYFVRDDDTVLTANLPQVWHSKNIVPTVLADSPWNFAQGLALADKNFQPAAQGVTGSDLVDNCFQGWDRRAEIRWPRHGRKLVMGADAIFRNFVLYLPEEKPFFCAEAVTNINDGFNLMARGAANTGTIVLQHGETLAGAMWFDAA